MGSEKDTEEGRLAVAKKNECRHCIAARAALRELLTFEIRTEEDGDVPAFSEAGLYPTFGKEDARSIRARLRVLCEALGVDMHRPSDGDENDPTDHTKALWRVFDGITEANDAMRELRYAVDRLNAAEDFANIVNHAKHEIEDAFRARDYDSVGPGYIIRKLANTLGIDERGKVMPKWRREEAHEEDE